MAARGSKLQVEKVHSNVEKDFTTTTDFTLLHCNNFDGNNNKFYMIEIQKNSSDEYQLFSNYGRLGSTTVYEVRKHFKGDDAPITDFNAIEDEYDAIIAKKERGKTVKGVKEFYTKVDVLAPTVGSSNIADNTDVSVSQEAEFEIDSSLSTEVNRIIQQIKADNIHNILSKTSLKLTSRGFETDVGVVTDSHIDRAVEALESIRDAIVADVRADVILANNIYFSLIPKASGARLVYEQMVISADVLAEHFDLMEDLRSALKVNLQPTDKAEGKKFAIDLMLLDYADTERDRLISFFESRKHSSHAHLNTWKVKNVFSFGEIEKRIGAYENKLSELGNEHELFHGSRNGNILSILINGFMIPPATAGHCTGRMFGNGVYSASCSSKALNYSTGFWDGGADDSNAFIFITRFVMGKQQDCRNFKYSGADSGYDSIHGLSADNGGTLLNDEYIVYDTNQTLITHLIELQK